MKNEINVRHLLILSLGYNDFLHEEIEKVYDKRRWEYYEAFKNSGFYDDMVIKSFTVQKEDKMRKVAGIVEWSYSHQDATLIRQLINKGYKNVVRYYEQNKKKLDLEQLIRYILKRTSKEVYHLSELDITMHQVILLYLAHTDKVNIAPLFQTSYGEIVLQSLNHFILDIGAVIILQEEMRNDEYATKESLELIKDTFNIDLLKKHPNVVSNIFDYTIDTAVEREAIKQQISSPYQITGIRSSLFRQAIIKHIGAYSTVLKMSGINYGDLLNIHVTDETLKLLAFNALSRKKENNLNEVEVKEFFVASLYMYAVLEHYKKQKEVLISDTTEAWYVDVKNREKQLEESMQFYERLKKNLEKQTDEEKRRRKESENKASELEKEVERLRTELEKNQEEKDELVELRNYVYNQKKSDFISTEISITEALSDLTKHKIVVCGGHPNMLRKLKEWIPEIETVDTDTLNKNFAFLTNYDMVFFYPNYANHSFYKKIKKSIENTPTKFAYLPDIDNMERIVMEMHDSMR